MSFHLKGVLVLDTAIVMVVAIGTGIAPKFVFSMFLSNDLHSSLNKSYFDDTPNTDNNNDNDNQDATTSSAEAAALSLLGPIFTIVMVVLAIILMVSALVGGKSARSKDRIVDVKLYQAQNKGRLIAALAQQRIVVAVFGSLLALWTLLDILMIPRSNYKSTPLLIHLGVCVLLAAVNASALLLSFCDEFIGEDSMTEPSVSQISSGNSQYTKLNNINNNDDEANDVLEKDLLKNEVTIQTDYHHAAAQSGQLNNDKLGEGGNENNTTEEINSGEDDKGDDDGKEEKGWYDLLVLAWPQRWWIAAACGCLLIRLPFSLAVPHFVAVTLGAVIDENLSKARYYILCLVVCGTIDSLLDFWNYFLFGYAQQRLIKDLRLCLFRKILSQDISFFDGCTSGDLTSRLTSDTSEMSNDLTWVFRFTIESLVRIGGITAYMFYAEWKLACVAISLVPVCAVVGKLYGNWLHENAKQVQTALAKANATATEAIGSVRTVVLCGCEKAEWSRYSLAITRYFILNVRQTAMQAGYYMVVNTFMVNTALQAALLWYGAILVVKENMHPQVLIAFMLYQGQLQEYTANLINSLSNLIKSSGAGAKVFELLEREPVIKSSGVLGEVVTIQSENETRGGGGGVGGGGGGGGGSGGGGGGGGGVVSMSDHQNPLINDQTQPEEIRQLFRNNDADKSGGCRVEFNNVWFTYQSRKDSAVLRGLSFTAEKGTTVALVGASGAGKSTVFHLLCRLYDPTQGIVSIDGADVSEYAMSYLRSTIAVVAQEPVLFSGSILENILYGISRTISPQELLAIEGMRQRLLDKVRRVCEMANALNFIQALPNGFDTEVGERGVQLSGGQKQRIAIARALLSEPNILLLDEATSALDTASEALVQSALTKAAVGRTTLVIAHRLATIQNADKILVLDRGVLVESGTHDELLNKTERPGDSESELGWGTTYKMLAARQMKS